MLTHMNILIQLHFEGNKQRIRALTYVDTVCEKIELQKIPK